VEPRKEEEEYYEIGWKVVEWIHLAQDRNNWWAPGHAVKNLWLHKGRGIS
jgi:hypothetical protein